MNTNKAYAALQRVLINLSKAVLKIKCTFNFLNPNDENMGYTYRRQSKGKNKEDVAEIFINRDHAMFYGLDDAKKNVAAFGVATHEMLHQKFTDFREFESNMRRTPDVLLNVFKTVFNIFEDGRIEYFANQVFGGKALSSLNYIKKLTWEESPEIDKTADPLTQILNALIQYGDMGRVKGEFSDEDTQDTFLYCADLYDRAIVCTKCKDCLILSRECTDYLYKKYAQKINRPLANNIVSGGRGEDAKEQSKGSKSANAKQQNRNATKQKIRNSKNNSQKGENQSNSNAESNENKNNNGNNQTAENSKQNTSENGNSNSKGKNRKNNSQQEGNNGNNSEENDAEDGQDEQNGQGEGDEEANGMESQEEENGNNSQSGNNEGEDTGNSSNTNSDNSAGGNDTNGSNSSNNSSNSGADNDNSDEEGEEVNFNEFIFDEEDVEDFAEELEGKMEAAAEAIDREVKMSEGDVYTFRLEDAECDKCIYRTVPCDEQTFRDYQSYADTHDISGYADELSKDISVILKTKPTGWERNKSGKLNIKRWMDPNFNSPYIFDKRLSNESSIAVSILIDESGSMTGDRINSVRQMACVLAEAFIKLNVKFNILGHTGGDDEGNANSIREYSDFDSDVFEQVIWIKGRSYNFDGASIKVATDKLAAREERNKLMFVLTDGASHNVANTELAIRDANKISTVIGVALAVGRDREVIEKMYGNNFVMVQSMDDLMNTIGDKLKEVSGSWT